MSNTLNLGITLKADGSGLVGELKVTEKQLKKLDTGIKNTEKDAKGAGRAMRDMSKATGVLRGGVNGLSRGLFSLNGLFAGLSLVGVSASFLSAARSTENYKARLKILLGSQAEGNRLFEEMTVLAAKVPQSYDEIMASATNLSGVMSGGVDEIAQWMPMIADLAASTGLSVEETTGQVIRMYSAGAASADMFRERGVLSMLGFQAGVSYSAEETKKILIDAYESPLSKFKGAALEQAKTWDGLLSMIGDKWFQVRTTIMDSGVFEYLKGWLNLLNNEFSEVLDGTKTEAQAWADSIIGGLENIGWFFAKIGDVMAGWKMIFVVLELAWKKFIAAALDGIRSLVEGMHGVSVMADDFLKWAGIPIEIDVSPGAGLVDLRNASKEINGEIATLKDELASLAGQELPSDKFERLNTEIKAATQSAAIYAESEADIAFMMRETEAASRAKAKATADATAKQKEATKALQEWADAAYQKYIPAEEKILDEMFKLEDAYDRGMISLGQYQTIMQGFNEELAKGTDELKKQPDEIFNLGEAWKQVQNNLQDGFSELFVGMFHGEYMSSIKEFGKKVLDIFLKLIADIAAAWVASKIFGGSFSLGGLTSGGGIGGAISSGLSGLASKAGGGLASLFGGGAAAGGTLAAPSIGTGISTVFGGGAAAGAGAGAGAGAAALPAAPPALSGGGGLAGISTSMGSLAMYAGAAYVAVETLTTLFTDSPMEIAIAAAKNEFAALNENMMLGGEHVRVLGEGVTSFGEANGALWSGLDLGLNAITQSGEATISNFEALEQALMSAGVQVQYFGEQGGQSMYKLSGNVNAAKDIIGAFGQEGQSALNGIVRFTDLAGNSWESLKERVSQMGGTIQQVEGEFGQYSGLVTGSIAQMIALQNQFGTAIQGSVGDAGALARAIASIPNPPSVPGGGGGGAIPQYAVGSPYIPQDQIAKVHQGEMVIDKESADALRKYGIKTGGGGSESSLTPAIQKLIKLAERQLEALQGSLQAAETANLNRVGLTLR